MYINLSRDKLIKSGALIVIILLCAAVVGVILSGINQFKLGSQLASVNQVSNLSHLLVRQQANLFGILLDGKAKQDELIEALDNLSREEFVLDASLYSASGKLIAQSHQAAPLKSLLNPPEGAATNTQQIVEPIIIQQNLQGFIRVTFDAQYGQTTKTRVDQLFRNLYGELLILFLAGGLFVSCFYLFRKKAPPVQASPKNRVAKPKGQSQRFHARRRRFSA
ncbi:hemolysin regulation protein AhpA [Pasteurellaceae bacterium RH1A]|nr:hemolysin regulation protein AhpA [Pasteurellaceae bacterium RH1A]